MLAWSVKLWYSVDVKFSEQLKMAFLSAQQSKDVCVHV